MLTHHITAWVMSHWMSHVSWHVTWLDESCLVTCHMTQWVMSPTSTTFVMVMSLTSTSCVTQDPFIVSCVCSRRGKLTCERKTDVWEDDSPRERLTQRKTFMWEEDTYQCDTDISDMSVILSHVTARLTFEWKTHQVGPFFYSRSGPIFLCHALHKSEGWDKTVGGTKV